MKVVINDCYGGFGLSLEGQRRYLELIGKKAYFFKLNFRDMADGSRKYEPIDSDDDDLFTVTFTVPDPEKYLIEDKRWSEMSKEERIEHNRKYDEIGFYSRDIKRNDPILIQVIEELGSNKASGRCAELKIIEIPDDVDWEIDEYDGMETVEEKHRSWR